MKTQKLIYRCILVLVGVIATIATFTDHLTALGGNGRPTALFFTSWSVWFALLSAILVLVSTVQNKEMSKAVATIKFSATIMIIATFIVAGFVLPDKLWTAGYWTFGGTFKHFLLPVLTVVDCILFDKDHAYTVAQPFIACIAPLLYWIVVIIRILIFRSSCGGAIEESLWGQYYPYGFTNFDNGHSLGGLCGLLAGILAGLILIGFVFFFVNKASRKKN